MFNLISDRVIWYRQLSWWLKLASVKEFLCQSHSLWSRPTFETLKHFMVANFRYQLSWWYQITLLYSPTDVAWPQFSKSLPPSWFQIGLAVGDIDTIRKTAALERYTSQVCRIQRICYHFCEEPVVISYNVMKKLLFLRLNSYRNWISWITSDSQDILWYTFNFRNLWLTSTCVCL